MAIAQLDPLTAVALRGDLADVVTGGRQGVLEGQKPGYP